MKRSHQFDVPAVIVGGGLNALGVLRSLATAGVPVLVVDTDLRSPAIRSRYGRKVVVPTLEGSDLISDLLHLGARLKRPAMLFLTEERSVVTVSEERSRLEQQFVIRMPEHDRLMSLMQKHGFQKLAETVDAPVPRTVWLRCGADLERVKQLTFPCVLKPNSKDYAYGARFKKAYLLNSYDEVSGLYEEIEPTGTEMVVQEWISGADSDIYFCLQYIGFDHKLVSSFTGRKIRSWPLGVGGTASCTAAAEHAVELQNATTDFFNRVGFVGMGSMEYKRDTRDGRFYMVEPTVARSDLQEEVATLNGVNIPLAAYCHETEQPLPALLDSVPTIWRDPLSDRYSFRENNRCPDERSRAHRVRDAYWRWNDPLPWMDVVAAMVALKLGASA